MSTSEVVRISLPAEKFEDAEAQVSPAALQGAAVVVQDGVEVGCPGCPDSVHPCSPDSVCT